VITPTATITGAAHADSTKKASATVTIVSGISISINPTTATVGTLETFTFAATVSNPGCNQSADPQCLAVTWSVPTATGNTNGTITDNGIANGIDSAIYTAPTPAPNPSAVTITATSVKDTSVTATASVTIVTAAPPTVTSVSPKLVIYGTNCPAKSRFNLFKRIGPQLVKPRVRYFAYANDWPAGLLEENDVVLTDSAVWGDTVNRKPRFNSFLPFEHEFKIRFHEDC